MEILRGFQRRLADRLPQEGLRWNRSEQFHLTLRFLGQVPAEAVEALQVALRNVCRNFFSFRLALDRCGCFPRDGRPRVLWLGLGGELQQLMELRRQVVDATICWGDHQESNPFAPHVTLGRVRPGSQAARALAEMIEANLKPQSTAWTVEALDLMRSELGPEGARHIRLQRIVIGHSPTASQPKASDSILPGRGPTP